MNAIAQPAGELLDEGAFHEALRAIGAQRYHSLHPFHRRLHDGLCTRAQVQAWALNRFYYQSRIPGQGRGAAGAIAHSGVAARVAAQARGP